MAEPPPSPRSTQRASAREEEAAGKGQPVTQGGHVANEGPECFGIWPHEHLFPLREIGGGGEGVWWGPGGASCVQGHYYFVPFLLPLPS